MSVVLLPDAGEIAVYDTIRVPDQTTEFEFVLNAGLALSTENGTLETIAASPDGLRKTYRVSLQTPGSTLKLHYRGHPAFAQRTKLGDMPHGIISADGVYLDGSAAWYPLFDQPISGFSMRVTLPEGWHSVSIGKRMEKDDQVIWSTEVPHDDLYLLAGRYTRHARPHRGIELSVWLLEDDPALADRYLTLSGEYVDHYGRLIGDYPYAKFAVVENRWQTGFGMPSFTLLGSRVMRLPFIPYTSLPHEILHNWWGNGVWVDYAAGNWSEGLTAYLADHWMQEQQGQGAQYRLKALQRYSNFAAKGKDMPLRQFVSRHSDASQSIGYSKSLMLFHMLRRSLGDEAFVTGLRRLWREHAYTSVGFDRVVQTTLGPAHADAGRFAQWLEREGAPRLRLDAVEVLPAADGYRLLVTLSQEQLRAFAFDLPLAVTLQGESSARWLSASVDQKRQRFEFVLPARPVRVDIDPGYDMLRTLDPTEQPPALNRLFGGDAWLVIPTSTDPAMRAAWQQLAGQWQRRYPGLRTIDDRDAADLGAKDDRIILGWDNRLHADAAARIRRDGQRLERAAAGVAGKVYPATTHGLVLVNSDAEGTTTAFIGAHSAEAVQTLARKLPHYGSYGRLVFDGSGTNLVKDTLTSEHSRLSRQLGDETIALRLAPRPALTAD